MMIDLDSTSCPLEVKGFINYAAYGKFADHFQDPLLFEAKVRDYLGLEPLFNHGIKAGGATILNAAMAKLFCSERYRQVANHAVQTTVGKG
jgi:hypothetical protein